MSSYNKVILVGNLTREPELTYTTSQTAICKFGLAMNRKYKGADNTDRTDTCFVDCTAFGRVGEVVSQYCQKGGLLLVEGRLNLNQWTADDGSKRQKLEVVAESIQLMGGNPNQGQNQQEAQPQNNQQPQQKAQPMNNQRPPQQQPPRQQNYNQPANIPNYNQPPQQPQMDGFE